MTMVKRSKKNVLLVLLLTCILSATLVALRVHITSASQEYHNISVECIFDVTYPRWNSSYNRTYGVHVKNNGTGLENFTLTICNITDSQVTIIGEKSVSLSNGTEEIIKFTLNHSSVRGYPDDPIAAWNETGYFTHKIWANASIVEDEAITEDNVCGNTAVSARWNGDVNGDGHVNQTDLDIIQDHFGKEFPDANYTASADLNLDGIIDITDCVTYVLDKHNGPLDIHDVAVTDIFNVTYPTWNNNSYLTFGVTVKNNGWHYSETFHVTIYNGTNLIGNETVTNLASRAEKIVNFTLQGQHSLDGYPDNPSAIEEYPTHTIKANASEVDDEFETENNEHENVTVTVRWPGDVNGDYQVNQGDKNILNDHLNSTFPNPNYTASVDFNIDGIINATDLEILENETHWHNGPVDYCDIALYHIDVWSPLVGTWNDNVYYAYPGWNLSIWVWVRNFGNNTHTFNVTVYANSTVIDTQSVTLNPGGGGIKPFIWNVGNISKVWPYPFHTITATASILECDDNSTNNDFTYGNVTVRWAGDTNGDGYLNETDLSILSDAIEDYDYNADFNGNYEIDLDDVQKLISEGRWREGPRLPDPDP